MACAPGAANGATRRARNVGSDDVGVADGCCVLEKPDCCGGGRGGWQVVGDVRKERGRSARRGKGHSRPVSDGSSGVVPQRYERLTALQLGQRDCQFDSPLLRKVCSSLLGCIPRSTRGFDTGCRARAMV